MTLIDDLLQAGLIKELRTERTIMLCEISTKYPEKPKELQIRSQALNYSSFNLYFTNEVFISVLEERHILAECRWAVDAKAWVEQQELLQERDLKKPSPYNFRQSTIDYKSGKAAIPTPSSKINKRKLEIDTQKANHNKGPRGIYAVSGSVPQSGGGWTCINAGRTPKVSWFQSYDGVLRPVISEPWEHTP